MRKKFYIREREVRALYFQDMDFLYIELLLKEGDCPENKKFPELQLCPGDCQGTFLSIILKNNTIKFIGSIYPKSHVMYSESFVKKHKLKREEIKDYIENYLKTNSFTIKTYMSGRKKRIYVGKEHVQTVFEGCVFRIGEGEFAELLISMRRKEIEEIFKKIERIKKIAMPTTMPHFFSYFKR